MERQANYVIVGAISIAILIGTFVFVVWLANYQFNQKYDSYRVIFHGPVSGLSKGGEVQFNGIKVGEITDIALDQADPNRVFTDLQVEAGTPVRADSTAQAVAQGITGVRYIQISAGTTSRPLLRFSSREHPPVIAARRGRMEEVVQDISKLTANGAEALERVNRLLSDGNITTVSQSLADVRAVTSEFSNRKQMFGSMDSALIKLDRAATDLQTVLASARGSLGGKDKGAFADLAGASNELRSAVVDLRALVAKLDGPVSDMSTTTVPGITAAMASIQKAADRMESLGSELEQNPRALLTKQGGREMEIPQ